MDREHFNKLLDYLDMRSQDIELGLADVKKLSATEFSYLQGQQDELKNLFNHIVKLREEQKANDK